MWCIATCQLDPAAGTLQNCDRHHPVHDVLLELQPCRPPDPSPKTMSSSPASTLACIDRFTESTLLSCQVLMTRHTVMVVGQTSGGKSVVINTLAKAQTRMGKRTTLSVVNPKVFAVPRHRLCWLHASPGIFSEASTRPLTLRSSGAQTQTNQRTD